MMKETPLLFNTDMVRAIFRPESPKTQTRRTKGLEAINQDPGRWRVWGPTVEDRWMFTDHPLQGEKGTVVSVKSPYGQAGDRIWGRETHAIVLEDRFNSGYLAPYLLYRADGERAGVKWKPSIFLPRLSSRITLEIVSVRLERLQDISEVDAKAEGMPEYDDWPNFVPCPKCHGYGLYPAPGEGWGVTEHECYECNTPRKQFKIVWNSINAKHDYGWDSNPWVWAIEFKRVQP